MLHRYQQLDDSKARIQKFHAETEDFDAILKYKIDSFLYGDKDFIYKNDIKKVWDDFCAINQTKE
jgi:salicylate hydroxylase